MTRSRIKFEGKYYKTMPWLKHEECVGCHFSQRTYNCPNQQTKEQFCDTDGEFYGYVFIEHGKEGLAKYIATKLGGSDES